LFRPSNKAFDKQSHTLRLVASINNTVLWPLRIALEVDTFIGIAGHDLPDFISVMIFSAASRSPWPTMKPAATLRFRIPVGSNVFLSGDYFVFEPSMRCSVCFKAAKDEHFGSVVSPFVKRRHCLSLLAMSFVDLVFIHGHGHGLVFFRVHYFPFVLSTRL
jgi:hypothetical protein